MSILIGGSSSSGSTMLRYALNANSHVFSGAELNFFNKDVLFDDWYDSRHLLLGSARRLSTGGWAQYPGHNLLHQDYKWSIDELRELIGDSRSIKEFYIAFFSRALRENSAAQWVEKTPSNTYCFERFLNLDPANKVVHIVRNPYDTIASLLRRGHSPFFAVGTWIYNNSAALSVEASERYLRVIYEDLVEEPERTFSRLFDFIGVPSVPGVQGQQVCSEKTDLLGISSWRASPKGAITSSRVGGFFELDPALQEKVIYAFSAFRIREAVLKRNNLACADGMSLCDLLGYEYFPSVKDDIFSFNWALAVDLVKRSALGYRTGFGNYPAALVF